MPTSTVRLRADQFTQGKRGLSMSTRTFTTVRTAYIPDTMIVGVPIIYIPTIHWVLMLFRECLLPKANKSTPLDIFYQPTLILNRIFILQMEASVMISASARMVLSF